MLIKKLSSSTFILHTCRPFFQKRHEYLINNTLSMSYINYFNVLWILYKNEINKINKYLRRAGSIILQCKRYEVIILIGTFVMIF